MAASSTLERLDEIARVVVRDAAVAVDREARFPHEAFESLRTERLLAAAIPIELGGLGSSFGEVATMCTTLGRACASSAMIFAMHHVQVACMVQHGVGRGGVPGRFWESFLRRVADDQLLVASATSEHDVGGNLRASIAAVELGGDRFRIRKRCTTISYAEHADAILITARRNPASAAGDQSLALVCGGQYLLERLGAWDTLGMRGTCSPPFEVTAEAPAAQVLPVPFQPIASQTMVPYSHLLWSACWLGLAEDAVTIATTYVKRLARRSPGTVPYCAARLAGVVSDLQAMRAVVNEGVREYESRMASGRGAAAFGEPAYVTRINSMKVSCSALSARICTECLAICGMAGYSNGSPFSLGRHVRDAMSAPLMISNDRIMASNTEWLMV